MDLRVFGLIAIFLIVLLSGCIFLDQQEKFIKKSTNFIDYAPDQKPPGLIQRTDETYSSGEYSFTVIIYEMESYEIAGEVKSSLSEKQSAIKEQVGGYMLTTIEDNGGPKGYAWLHKNFLVTVAQTKTSNFNNTIEYVNLLRELTEKIFEDYEPTG